MKLKYIMILFAAMTLMACGSDNNKQESKDNKEAPAANESAEVAGKDGQVTYRPDTAMVFYDGKVDPNKAFIVISKKELRLSVYADINGDTTLVARYPVCISRNKGQKEKSGDMRTPESEPGAPFKIKQIQEASTWSHDFGDGRGSILSYGNWFMRLETPFSGIGIHGSTNNENSVPGRASEGCIRLLDQDIITLKKHFAYVGMPVIIQGETDGPLPWETRARKASGK